MDNKKIGSVQFTNISHATQSVFKDDFSNVF